MGSEKVVFLVIFIHPFENSGGYFFRGRLFWWILDINLQNFVRGYFSKFSLRALRKMYPLKNWTMLHPWNPLVFSRAFASLCLLEQLSLLGMVKPLR